jgi:hypothetical protein
MQRIGSEWSRLPREVAERLSRLTEESLERQERMWRPRVQAAAVKLRHYRVLGPESHDSYRWHKMAS